MPRPSGDGKRAQHRERGDHEPRPLVRTYLRHTCASHLAQRVALPVAGAVLGHAGPKTTARYAHVDTAALALDPRLHLTFAMPSGTVTAMAPAAHAVHTGTGPRSHSSISNHDDPIAQLD